MKYVTRILIALVVLAILASCTPATDTAPSQGSGSLQSNDPDALASRQPELPSSEPAASSGDDAAPSPDPFTVTTLDGTDITARVTELWSFANRTYSITSMLSDDLLVRVYDGYSYFGVVETFDSTPDYFTENGLNQLASARNAYGEPIFYRHTNDRTYRRIEMASEEGPGEITDIETLSVSDERIVLAIEYLRPRQWLADTPPTESDNVYALFTIANTDGTWKIDDYEHPGSVDGMIYSSTVDYSSLSWDCGFVPRPDRDDLTGGLYALPYLNMLRRVYFLDNCGDFGIDRTAVDYKTITWQDDQTFTFSLHDGAPYSVYFYTAAEIASRSPDDEIFDCTLDALPLEADRLAYFNTEYFNAPAGDPRRSLFPNQFLTSEYATPDDIDLHQLFYNGFTADLTDAERAYCEQNGFWMNLDIQRTTAAEMSEILNEYTGETMAFSHRRNLDAFLYNPDTDAYYLNHSDTNAITVTFTNGWLYPDGRITLRYTAVDYTYPDDAKPMELTLQRTTATTYHILSNLPVS